MSCWACLQRGCKAFSVVSGLSKGIAFLCLNFWLPFWTSFFDSLPKSGTSSTVSSRPLTPNETQGDALTIRRSSSTLPAHLVTKASQRRSQGVPTTAGARQAFGSWDPAAPRPVLSVCFYSRP